LKETAIMTLRNWLAAVVCCALCSAGLVALSPATAAEAKTKPATLRVGIIKSMFRDTPPALVQFVMNPFKKLLEKETGMAGEIVTGGDADSLGTQLADDKVQLGVFQGVEFAWARLKNPNLTPLIIAVNKDTEVKAAVVVRADSKAEGVCDLHGQDIALPRMSHEHCHLFLQRRCAKPGECPEKSFHKVTTPATAEDALDDVVDNVVQGAVIDTTALDAYKANKPGRAGKLKVLVESEAFPCGVIAYHPGALDEATLAKIKTGLVNAGKTPQGKNFFEMVRITGFRSVPDSYEQLFKDIAKAYPPSPPK
jgi:ABC-type phosphate/phosphonate transport system substrate-binding protein